MRLEASSPSKRHLPRPRAPHSADGLWEIRGREAALVSLAWLARPVVLGPADPRTAIARAAPAGTTERQANSARMRGRVSAWSARLHSGLGDASPLRAWNPRGGVGWASLESRKAVTSRGDMRHKVPSARGAAPAMRGTPIMGHEIRAAETGSRPALRGEARRLVFGPRHPRMVISTAASASGPRRQVACQSDVRKSIATGRGAPV